MKNLALQRIQELQPYSPPLEGRANYDGLLLDFNERTVPPAIELNELFDDIRPQLYPAFFDLPSKIATYADVNPEQVMITNGTDQAIDVIVRTFADVDNTVIIPEPSFAMYRQSARVAGNQIVSPQYAKNDLAFPTQAITEATDEKTKLVVICNPNNPTGTLVPQEEVEEIAAEADGAIVYVDEAYFEFSQQTSIPLIEKYPNVIVSRTFSKAFGLAGLRIGYVVARQLYIDEMLKVRGPYDVNQVASYAASVALSELDATSSYRDEVMNEAKPLVEQFFDEHGITFYPSAGNFVLFKPDDAVLVANMLQQNGILLRPQNKPPIEDTLRVTIGTVAQMQHFIDVYTAHELTSD
jgi:histidinol-phosphate aminotransferase